MSDRLKFQGGSSGIGDDRGWQAPIAGIRPTLASTGLALLLALPTVATAKDVFDCRELKAAVVDSGRGFASHMGALNLQDQQVGLLGKTYLARKSMTGASACKLVEVSFDEPKMLVRQTAYSCQFPGASKLDMALRAQLTRCVSGEVDDPSDPDELSIWVDRVSSGEGYRVTEVNAQLDALANALTLMVRLAVCTNKGNSKACED